MEIRIGKLKISGAALMALAAAYFFDTGDVLLAAVVATAVHEAGHLIAVKICGMQIAEFKYELLGLEIRCDSQMSYKAEIITTSSGPFLSLVLAIAASFAGRYFDSQEAYIISGVSILFCVFNMLPALPLDGGRILYAAVAMKHGIEKAERILCVTTCTLSFLLLVAGAALLIVTKVNFSLLLVALGLLISYCKRSGISIKSKRKMYGSESWIKN